MESAIVISTSSSTKLILCLSVLLSLVGCGDNIELGLHDQLAQDAGQVGDSGADTGDAAVATDAGG